MDRKEGIYHIFFDCQDLKPQPLLPTQQLGTNKVLIGHFLTPLNGIVLLTQFLFPGKGTVTLPAFFLVFV